MGEKLIPYNLLWLDCIQNNLLSILIGYDKSFSNLPFTFSAEYWKKISIQKFSSDDTYRSLLEQGLFIPKINYHSGILYSFFNFEDKYIDYPELDSIHEIIEDALAQQQYIFIDVDRFFYPVGREANKIHFVHPSFIYGLSHDRKSYEAIEDCISPGIMQYFQTPMDAISHSTKHLLDSDRNVRIRIVSLNKEKINDWKMDFTNSTLLDMMNGLSANKIVYLKHYDLYYQVGISALEEYFDEIEKIIPHLNDRNIFALRTNSYVQIHKRNEMLFKTLHETGIYNHSSLLELSERSNALSAKWEIYKNAIVKSLITKRAIDMPLMKEHLKQIISLEKDIMRVMRNAIFHH